MAKVFRPSTRESSIISKIESSKEHARRLAISRISDCSESLGTGIASKLVEESLVETRNINGLEKSIVECLESLVHSPKSRRLLGYILPRSLLVGHSHFPEQKGLSSVKLLTLIRCSQELRQASGACWAGHDWFAGANRVHQNWRILGPKLIHNAP